MTLSDFIASFPSPSFYKSIKSRLKDLIKFNIRFALDITNLVSLKELFFLSKSLLKAEKKSFIFHVFLGLSVFRKIEWGEARLVTEAEWEEGGGTGSSVCLHFLKCTLKRGKHMELYISI